jgi:hypothetical protein
MNDEFALYEAVLFAVASCPRAHDHRLRLTLAGPDDVKELTDQVGIYRSMDVTIVLKRLACPVQAACHLLHEFGHFWSDKVHGNPVQKVLEWRGGIRNGRPEATRDQRIEILEEEVRAWYLGTFVLYNVEPDVADELFEHCIQAYAGLSSRSLRDCGEEVGLGEDAYHGMTSWPYLDRWLRSNLPKVGDGGLSVRSKVVAETVRGATPEIALSNGATVSARHRIS